MSALLSRNSLHLYRLAMMEGELMASAALMRITGHADDVIRIRTGMLALRYVGWDYDRREDMSPGCQALAVRVRQLAQQISPAEWQWAAEYENNHRAQATQASKG